MGATPPLARREKYRQWAQQSVSFSATQVYPLAASFQTPRRQPEAARADAQSTPKRREANGGRSIPDKSKEWKKKEKDHLERAPTMLA